MNIKNEIQNIIQISRKMENKKIKKKYNNTKITEMLLNYYFFSYI